MIMGEFMEGVQEFSIDKIVERNEGVSKHHVRKSAQNCYPDKFGNGKQVKFNADQEYQIIHRIDEVIERQPFKKTKQKPEAAASEPTTENKTSRTARAKEAVQILDDMSKSLNDSIKSFKDTVDSIAKLKVLFMGKTVEPAKEKPDIEKPLGVKNTATTVAGYNDDLMSIRRFCSENNITITTEESRKLGEKLTIECQKRGIKVGKMDNNTYEKINQYPRSLIIEFMGAF